MGTKKGQVRKTARRAYEPKKKKKREVPRSGWGTNKWKRLMMELPNVPYYGTKPNLDKKRRRK